MIKDLWVGGPPWALTLVARFDDEATTPDGERLYANRVAMVLRARWGKIVEHEDFYEDTARILDLERALRERGMEPVSPMRPGDASGPVDAGPAGVPLPGFEPGFPP